MSTNAPSLSWHALALAPSTRVRIEASAGTGKTWTISVLYLRLLLERSLSPRQILVATFTDAAAGELHERLRLRLLWAERAAAQAGAGTLPSGAADDLAYLRQRWQDQPAQCDADRLRLRLALAELDAAPIGTLHSTCRRILADYPFASATPFVAGDLISSKALQAEMLADLKRQLAQSPDPISEGDARWLASFAALAPALNLLADDSVALQMPEPVDLAQLMAAANVPLLRGFIADVAQFMRSNSAYRTALIRLADYIEAGDCNAKFEPMARVAVADLNGHIREPLKQAAQSHPAVLFAAQAAQGFTRYDAWLRATALAGYRERFARWRDERLAARGQFTYDTLIERVDAALHTPGNTLADALFTAWPVALIDEFQDTNARQHAILDRIYRDDSGGVRGLLAMIGDPKQAIYAFRGGDIHTYHRAVAVVDESISLDTNHRAGSAYVDGLNTFYQVVAPGLTRCDAEDRFPYREVQAGTQRRAQPYTINHVEVAKPLVLHSCAQLPTTSPLRTQLALQACAWQIAGMLQSGLHRIGDRLLKPGDIAVLLPRNDHVEALRALLIECGVPCAGVGRQSVFHTALATELQLILYALVHRDQAGALRAALATSLLGLSLADIAMLDRDPSAWQSALERMQLLHDLWHRQGVLALVRHLLQHAPDGVRDDESFERSVTDLRHLGELLQEAAQSRRGPEQLLAWLDAQRHDALADTEAADEQQLRIESDAARTRLMTLHASKGLEFPIVFLPLMWSQSGRGRLLFPVVHDAAIGGRVVDLGTPDLDRRRAQAEQEDQDERFRLLYVALTRAQYACHVYVAPPSRVRDGRGATVAEDPERSALDSLVERLLAARQSNPSALDALPGLAWLDDDWLWPATAYRPDADVIDKATVMLAMPSPRPSRGVYSFSNLVRPQRASVVEESPALDESAPDANVLDEFALPLPDASVERLPHPLLVALDEVRGASLGNALHEVFEQREHGVPLMAQLPLLADALRDYGVSAQTMTDDLFVRTWAARLDAALAADLGDGLRLSALPAPAQRAEMEFHLAVDQVRIERLRKVCARHDEPDLIPKQIGVPALKGMLTGKIDLVLEHEGRFHVLDYKGNALSVYLDDYLPAALDAAMDAHHYRFQALIYTLAVDRMLAARVVGYQRAQHLGDAIYLFVRAAGLAPAAGIWRRRWPDALIEELQQVLSLPAEVA